jgi:hypothetical protein
MSPDPAQEKNAAAPPGAETTDTGAQLPKTQVSNRGQFETVAKGTDPTATAAPFLPTVPGFLVVRELGRGGMGVVYEARQEGLDRTVALKMLRLATKSAVARFRAEAHAIARLNHPDIVQVYAVGEFAGEPYLVLEYCPGGTLAQQIEQQRPPPAEAAAVVGRLARAVHAAHAAGVIHRDLKPGNVLITADGSPKVTDFGLAKLVGDESGMTATGDVLGTPCYMAPEQAGADLTQISPATDVYALGAILFELLTGRPPFRGANTVETLDHVRTLDPPRPRTLNPKVPDDLESVTLQCLEKAPAQRYPSAAALADDLARWAGGEPIRARRQTITYRLAKRLRRNRRAAWAALAVGLGVVGGWLGAADAGYGVPGGAAVRDWLDGRDASVLRRVPSDQAVREAAAGQRATLVRNLLGRRFGTGWTSDPGAIQSDAWSQNQVTAAVCLAPETDPAELPGYARVLDEMFTRSKTVKKYEPGFGWGHYNDGKQSGESSGWALSGIACAVRRGIVPPADRPKLLAHLAQLQADLERHQARTPGDPFTGGWLLFTNQQDAADASLYLSAVVCQGLLDLKDAGLGWRGDPGARDRLLAKTAGWLVSRFDGAGWRAQSHKREEYNDGITLLILAQLLRAEAAGLMELPVPIAQRVPVILDDVRTRPADYAGSVALFTYTLAGPDGQPMVSPLRTVRFPWHPWAVRVAQAWLDRVRRTGGPHADEVRTRRALAHLILTVGTKVTDDLRDDLTFLLAEELIGLSAVPPP